MAMEKVEHVNVLRQFARTVIGKAKHHAQGFEPLVLTLTGAVAAYADPGSVKAGARNGHFVNSCWFELDGTRYFLSYRDGVGRIRTGGKQGKIDLLFDETTTSKNVFEWFEDKRAIPVQGEEE